MNVLLIYLFVSLNDMLIGPVIVEDRMTGDSYLHFLQNDLPEELEDVPLDTRRHMYLQHDGAPHFCMRIFLDVGSEEAIRFSCAPSCKKQLDMILTSCPGS